MRWHRPIPKTRTSGARPIGCFRRKSGARAIGRSSGPTRNLRAGHSEYGNEFYPDIDDTAMVMLALSKTQSSDPGVQQACQQRAIDWLAGHAIEGWRLGGV